MTSIYLKDGKVLTKNGQLVADKNCCCDECKEECYGACINKENAIQCYERVNGVIQEVPCPPCGDECYYNSTSTPGISYVCLVTKTQEECEALINVDGNPSIFLGCGSLQKECYYNECNGLWFPLPGSSKGDQYNLGGCDNFVSNNCASEFCVEGCGSPCCCYRCVRNGEVDCQYTTKESCEECNQVHSCVEVLQTQCDGECPEGSTPSTPSLFVEVLGDNNAYATGSLTVGCGVILSAEVTYSTSTFASVAKIAPTLTIPGNATGTVSTQPIGDGNYSVSAVTVTSGGSGYTNGAYLTFGKAANDVVVTNATARVMVKYVEPQNAIVDVVSASGSGAVLQPVWQLVSTPAWLRPNIKVYRLASITVLNGGTGYADYDSIFISFPSGADGGVYYSAVIDTDIVGANGEIQQVYVADGSQGNLYRGARTDVLESVELLSGGAYYGVDETAPPIVSDATVTVVNGDGGAGASIKANIDTDTASPTFGKVTSFTINGGGSGYVSLCERARPVDSCSECPPLQSPESAICQSTKVDDGTKPCGTWTGGFPCNDTPCDEAQP